MVDLSVKLGDITLANPVMPASGTFNYDVGDVIDINRLGAMVAKTVSRDFRAGNPTPRMAETEAGIIQSIGLPGNGIKYFLDTMVPEYKKYTPPLVASISAETPEDFAAMARDISVPEVDIIEVNISCPTRDPSGGNFSLQTSHTRNVIKGIRAETDKPIWAKLSPNAGDIVSIGLAAEEGGADGLVIANTFLSLKIDTDTFRPALGNKFGGLVSPALKPIVLRMVYQTAKEVSIPIIGLGGVCKAEDVVEYMLAGASAVGVGYASFRNPSALPAIIDDLETWCASRGIDRLSDLIGAMVEEPRADTYEAAAMSI
jgi:dihydroorotate dehydrogenase (NAD+) catalytic subunit